MNTVTGWRYWLEALDTAYFRTGFRAMLQKRGGWLSLLFVGEMLTATAMSFFEHEIERAVVLAIFVPLIISSGGNSGSQASTLIEAPWRWARLQRMTGGESSGARSCLASRWARCWQDWGPFAC